MKIEQFTYTDEGLITAIATDQANYRVYLGIQNDDGCKLVVVNAFTPSETLFSIDVDADRINDIFIGNAVYLALDDDTNFTMWLSLTAPSTSNGYYTIPAGITEAPVRVVSGGSGQVFLTPGEDGGQNAKIVRMVNGVVQSTLELVVSDENIEFARGMALDSNDQIWIVCNTTPILLIKVNALATTFEVFTVE